MEDLIRHLRDLRGLANLVGRAPAFLEAIKHLSPVAESGATVLISGETGTGKELVARAIHYLSDKAAYAFVPVNCGSLIDTLFEDQLFGHEKGAFTDAHARRPGLIAEAQQGTLFLDEVDTLAEKAQVALLRVLEDKTFRAIGSSSEQQTDVRVVAATNVRLDQLVRAGTFRDDLYYRLCVFSIALPPLRERKEDIPALASHFLKKHAPTAKASVQLAPTAVATLASFDWPGNVRELENAIIRGIHLSKTDSIEIEDLGLPYFMERLRDAAPSLPLKMRSFRALKQETIQVFEREYLTRLLYQHRGNVSSAARTAGKERRDLGRLLKKYALDPKYFHSPGAKPAR